MVWSKIRSLTPHWGPEAERQIEFVRQIDELIQDVWPTSVIIPHRGIVTAPFTERQTKNYMPDLFLLTQFLGELNYLPLYGAG